MKRNSCRTGILAALLLVLPVLSHGSENAITISLKSVALVGGQKVLLGDIAEIRAASEDVVKMLSGIKMCASPSTGTRRALGPRDVELKLRDYSIALSDISINGASQVIVSRKTTEITADDLRKVIRDHIYRNMTWDRKGVTIEFRRDLTDISLPAGDIDLQAVLLSGTNYIGPQQFALSILADGELRKKLPVRVNIHVFQKVVVSTRQLSRKRIIRADDVELQMRELRQTGKTPFLDVNDVVGKRLKLSVSANYMLYHSTLEDAPAVQRGSYVTIRGKKGSITVSTRGQAMEEGGIGQDIQVKNLSSNRTVIARITGPDIVDVVISTEKQEERR